MIQAVILAAGKSTRTQPFTLTTPKPMLPVLGKPLITYTLEALKKTGKISDVVVVVGYLKEQIMALGTEFEGMSIKYVEQKTINGTGGAILACKDQLKEKFIVLNGDDMYSEEDLSKCLSHDHCILGREVDDPQNWGMIDEKDGKVLALIEKPETSESKLANTGVYVFDTTIFETEIKETKRGELEITDYVSALLKSGKEVSCETVKGLWLPVGFPWHLLEANVEMLKGITRGKSILKGKVEEHVKIEGFVYLEEGAVIKSHSRIEGPVYIGKGSTVGPFAHIRPDTIIGSDCNIGKIELYDAVIMDGTTAKHSGYIAHSVIGKDVNIGAGLITADYRHDAKNHITLIKEEKVDSGRRKLGSFIGDGVRTGIGTLIYPGRKLFPGTSTLPGEIVTKDKR